MEDLNAGWTAGVGVSGVPDQLIVSTATLVSRKFVLLAGQSVLRGTIMGQITTGGKVVASLSASSDGSQTPFCVAAETRDTTAHGSPVADLQILCYTSGRFNGLAPGGLILGASHTLASVREGLRGKGIIIDENPVL